MMADPAYQFPQRNAPHLQSERPYPPPSPTAHIYSHSRTRTSSSSVFPTPSGLSQTMYTASQNNFGSRRTPSTNTFSTTASSGNPAVPNRLSNNDLRRSTSSRSGGSTQPSSYVALMRKQKATVWCDRSQHEDPRLLAAQKAAKMRAAMEVLGGKSYAGRISTGGSGSLVGSNKVTAKIRHHGKAGLVGYSPAENLGVGLGGVPMRLSATEVEGGDSDDEADSGHALYHHRTGSGRSSLGSSSRRGLTYGRQSGASGASGRWSSGNTPPSERESRVDSLTDLAEQAEETPVPGGVNANGKEYFPTAANNDRAGSTGSGSSGEKADALGELPMDAPRLASNSLLKSTVTREKSTKNPDELRRRGSVDDRTMTMSAGRLYIANPDVDSD